MTANSTLVLEFLKRNFGHEYTKQEIADALGISVPAVTGSINGLTRKNYAMTTRVKEEVVAEATETRKEKVKKVPYHTLTEAGLAYDPIAEEEAKLAAKNAEKERKAAERAAAKAAKENA